MLKLLRNGVKSWTSNGSKLGINEAVGNELQPENLSGLPVSTQTTLQVHEAISSEPEKDTKFLLEQVDQSQQGFQTTDPDDPEEKLNFSENNFAQPEVTASDTETKNQSSAITCPQKCSYYQTFDTKPFLFKVESDLGAVQISAEPYHKFKSDDSKIWLIFKTPDGQTLNKSIKAIPDKKVLPRLAEECGAIQQWEEKVRKNFTSKIENLDCKFKVRILGDDDYEWISDCILQSVPNRKGTGKGFR